MKNTVTIPPPDRASGRRGASTEVEGAECPVRTAVERPTLCVSEWRRPPSPLAKRMAENVGLEKNMFYTS